MPDIGLQQFYVEHLNFGYYLKQFYTFFKRSNDTKYVQSTSKDVKGQFIQVYN